MPFPERPYRPNFRRFGPFLGGALFLALLAVFGTASRAGDRTLVQMKDFDLTEVKSAGFTLGADTKLKIHALGASAGKETGNSLVAYGWIINADSRDLVWKMTRDATVKSKDDRTFDGEITLPKGNYEVYFTAYAFALQSLFSSISVNIDRRDHSGTPAQKKRGFLPWLDEFFGGDMEQDWKKRSKNWGIEITIDGGAPANIFTPPKEFPNVLYRAVHLGENERIRQQFTLAKPMAMRIYALGEIEDGNQLADYGWILDVKSRRRVWEMGRGNCRAAGGADKNVKFDRVVNFPEGEYVLYYITDDSHSSLDWNSAPPEDPANYGVTLIAAAPESRGDFRLASRKDEENVLVQLTRVGNNENRTANFTLKAETQLRIYALGERQLSRRGMADYGWIVNAKTREKVWSMDSERTDHAGGSDKNRVIDEIITLPKGSYTVYYRTDDSHAYDDWNAKEPFDPEHWGITIYGAGDHFNRANVETNVNAKQEAGILAQIIHVGNNSNQIDRFSLDKQTQVRIFALGEGQNREMFDYGWIEKAGTHEIVWQMTYDMTFHAGGARKNRMVNTTIGLPKGNYELHFVSDDSHSYGDWNMDPPDDPTMWGITLYVEQ
jgi:hypothetical protein